MIMITFVVGGGVADFTQIRYLDFLTFCLAKLYLMKGCDFPRRLREYLVHLIC